MKDPKRNIVWIASFPKSGNTWFRLFLYSILNPEERTININSINSTRISSSRADFDSIAGTDSSDLTVEEINCIRPQIYRNISATSDKTTYIKVHDFWAINSSGFELFPSDITKGVILIVRNPFDLVISFSNHFGISIKEAITKINDPNLSLSGASSSLTSQLNQRINNWSNHFLSWADKSGLNVFVLRYEDMISRPISTFSKALDYLNIPVTSTQVEASINKCSFETLQHQEYITGFREKPISSKLFFRVGKSNYWKGILDLEDISLIKKNHSLVLDRLDYNSLL